MKISDIRFLPLDLPKFQFKEKVLEEYEPETKFYWWSEQHISERDRDVPFHNPMPIKPVHKELMEYVSKYLPFKGIVLCRLVRANEDVKPHTDDNYIDYKGPKNDCNTISKEFRDHQLATEPCGYRLIIEGDRKSLYLTDGAPKIIDDKIVYGDITEHISTEVPESTDTFLLKSYGSMHGVNKTENDDNRLLLFVTGWLDERLHRTIIERSLIKYGDYMR